MTDDSLITITLEDGRPFTFPRNLDNCVMGVFGGEYAYPKFPDEPEIQTVLDIGANVGAFAVWGGARWPRAEFTCYEPHPFARSLLEKNTEGRRVIVDGHAIAASDDTVTLYEGADMGQDRCNLGLTTIYENLLTEVRGKVTHCPALHPRDLPFGVDILKIDAEGVEWEILRWYPYLHRVWAVVLEFHRAEDIEPIRSLLKIAGLRCFRHDQHIDCVGRMMWCRTKSQYNRKRGIYE